MPNKDTNWTKYLPLIYEKNHIAKKHLQTHIAAISTVFSARPKTHAETYILQQHLNSRISINIAAAQAENNAREKLKTDQRNSNTSPKACLTDYC